MVPVEIEWRISQSKRRVTYCMDVPSGMDYYPTLIGSTGSPLERST